MQEQSGQIYCAILAATLETVIYRLEGKHWHEPMLVRIYQQADQKGTSISLEPLTSCGYVERVPVPSRDHVLMSYQPANDVTKAYKNAAGQWRKQGQAQKQQKAKRADPGVVATASMVPPSEKKKQ